MSKTIITTSTTSATGYELVIKYDNGDSTTYPLNEHPKNEPKTLVLPDNPSNRKYFNSDKVDKAGGTIELTYKETKHIDTSKRAPRKVVTEYLTEQEKADIELLQAQIDDILAKAKERRNAEKSQPKTEQEKLLARIEKLQAKLAELAGEEA